MQNIKEKCLKCGMIRSKKDLVILEDRTYICFSCWNQKPKVEEKQK